MKYVYSIIIILTILSGCSNNGSENDLEKENDQLRVENESLSAAKEVLELDLKILSLETARKNEWLNNDITSLQTDNENQLKIIERYQKAFEFPSSNNRTIANTLSIFSPEQVTTGSQIAGLIVSDKKEEAVNDALNYHVKFNGEFEVRGTIFHDVSGENEYSFKVTENLETMPHTLSEFETGNIYFDIANDEYLLKSVGNELATLPEDGQLDIVAVFKSYSYIYVPETDFRSVAEFVRLTEEN